MKIHTLEKEQLIKKPLSEVFSFFENPENLARITPPSLGFIILTPTPIIMKKGTVIDYTVRVMGLKVHWRSLISCYEPPHKFVDEQLKGPYKYWHHTHRFIEKPEGTLITDKVGYALPFGPLGSIMHRLTVKKQLEDIFEYRQQVIVDYFK